MPLVIMLGTDLFTPHPAVVVVGREKDVDGPMSSTIASAASDAGSESENDMMTTMTTHHLPEVRLNGELIDAI